MFGYEKGAFTGAVGTKMGLFESANEGTLFLDEIGELGQGLQVKLLRVMQDQEVRRVGGTTSTKVDVRIIAATNRDLEQLVKEGKFRNDLFYRLKVVPITLPSLAERREDIPMLVHHFLQKCSARTEHAVCGVLPETMALLTDYRWPGNVRELENVIERAVSLSHGPVLTPEDLPKVIRQGALTETETRYPRTNSHDEVSLTLEEVEKRHLIRVLKETNRNKVKAAKILGIDRRTLYRMAERFGLDLGEEAEGTEEKEPT
jgi:transcriptional regulator with PAS, ATPase and Fis domain